MRAILTTILIGAAMAASFARQDMQMPPRPDAELAKLNFLTGEFDQTDTYADPASNEKIEVKSKTSSKWVLSKRYVRSEYFGEMPGMGKFEGMMMLTWNEVASKYEATWFDSTGGWHIKAQGAFEGETLTMISEEEEMPGMGKTQFRLSYKKVDDKKVEFKLDMKAGADWSNIMTSMMTRKG